MLQERPLELKISGITCAGCKAGIEKHLAKLGFGDVYVDYAKHELKIPAGLVEHTDKITNEVKKLGYQINSPRKAWLDTLEKKFLFAACWTVPLILHMLLPHTSFLHNPWIQLALCLPVYILGLSFFGKSAWRSLKQRFPNMDVLIIGGASAAFIYSLVGTIGNLGPNYLFYETTASIITLVLLGNVMEERSVKKTSSGIEELGKLQIGSAKLVNKDNTTKEVEISELNIGDILQVNSGDRVPVDGQIISGNLLLDESMITGESLPIERELGAAVIGGTIINSGSGQIRATAVGEKTVLSQIIRLVQDAQNTKPQIQKLGDQVSAIFVPLVFSIAILTFILATTVFGISSAQALMQAIAVLVISCPCAMGLATPTAVMVGMGRAIKEGVIFRDGRVIENLAKIKIVAFDKTGTLTTGKFKLGEIARWGEEDLEKIKDIIYSLESHSSHPIAKSLVRELSASKDLELSEIVETRGQGISGKDSAGNIFSLVSASKHEKSKLYSLCLLKNNIPVAGIQIQDELKRDAKETISQLKSLGIASIIISGDKTEKVAEIAQQLEIKDFYAAQSPEQKLMLIEKEIAKSGLAYIGDGINDAPALEKASVGISLSGATSVAIESAQVILAEAKLSRLPVAVGLSRRMLLTIKQNLFWAFAYNIIAIPVAACGFLSPIVAALTMAFSDVIIIGNSLRLRWVKF